MWASILIKLAISVLAYYNARADYRDKILAEVRNAGLAVALEAERFKADARRAGGKQSFGVRGSAPAKPKPVQADDAGSDD